MIVIPLDNLADYTQTISLEGESYDLRLQYNPMRTTTGDGAWYFTVGAAGFTPSIQRKVTNGLDITEGFKYLTGVPPGNFYVVDVERDFGRVDRFGLREDNGRFQLVYLKTTEIVQQ